MKKRELMCLNQDGKNKKTTDDGPPLNERWPRFQGWMFSPESLPHFVGMNKIGKNKKDLQKEVQKNE